MRNSEENLAVLKDARGREIALKGVNVRARLHGLMAEVEVEQLYRNPQTTNIEAVYTFPLPLGAVLLGLEVEIAGKTLSGTVVEKKQAEREYEDAVTDGNSAVMLEEAGPGLYTASLGNLMAGESAVIRYRYGLLLSWQGSKLRFLLPTTIAPRYGDAGAAGLQPHQAPVTSLEAEYPLDLAVTVEGDLAAATIASPSHSITAGRSDTGIVVRLSGKPMLDRDFVLTLESQYAQSSCVLTPDRDGHVALASLRIPPLTTADKAPLALKVVIDCSGSMGGISIAQARKAALEMLNQLRPDDSFNVTLFGSKHVHLFRTMVPATARYVTEAWNRLDTLDATMGGTEMEKALDAVFALGGSDASPVILLITDGEIHQYEKLVKRAGKSGHRIFTVGVGTSVAEVFLKSLARTTHGSCELVAPREGMAECVLGQFHRMRQTQVGNVQIEWPVEPQWQTTLPEVVFAGDTVHVHAGFQAPVVGRVVVRMSNRGDVGADMVAVQEAEIPRLAAARRMESVTAAEGLRLALDYQLLSRWTNFLVIAERADKAEDLPTLHQVPQMLTAGWGGTADFSCSFAVCDNMVSSGIGKYDIPAFLRRQDDSELASLDFDESVFGLDGSGPVLAQSSLKPKRKLRLLTPSETVNRAGSQPDQAVRRGSPLAFIAAMERDLSARTPILPLAIAELEYWGLDSSIAQRLRQWVREGHAESEVVAAFVYALTQSAIGNRFDRALKRVILKGWKRVVPGQALDLEMKHFLGAVTVDNWDWMPSTADMAVHS
jgi:Ca-activated chloride channel family protein